MKLYYSKGACSLAPHICMREVALPLTLESVNLQTKKTGSGGDFLKINPKGYVPVLELDDGQVLTEGQIIMQYIADKRPEANLLPRPGTMERLRANEWLAFVATELHKGFSPLWNPKVPDDMKTMIKATLGKRFDFLAETLKSQHFLMGSQFTAPDAYLFTILSWSSAVQVDLAKWPVLLGFMERCNGRPSIRAALEAEGISKK